AGEAPPQAAPGGPPPGRQTKPIPATPCWGLSRRTQPAWCSVRRLAKVALITLRRDLLTVCGDRSASWPDITVPLSVHVHACQARRFFQRGLGDAYQALCPMCRLCVDWAVPQWRTIAPC